MGMDSPENPDDGLDELIFHIEPAAIWAIPLGGDSLRVYINEQDCLTLSREAVELLVKVLRPFAELESWVV